MRVIYGIFVALVLAGLYFWASAPRPLISDSDGLAEWQAASTRQQAVTANHYLVSWQERGVATGATALEMRQCIDSNLTTDRGIMATAAYCAQTIINPDP